MNRAWLAVAGWMAVIFIVSSQPDLPGPPDPLLDAVAKKAAHVVEYGVLGGLLARTGAAGPLAWVVGVLYGVSDELHQSFVPGRSARLLDLGLDAAGVALGLWGWLRWAERRAGSRRRGPPG